MLKFYSTDESHRVCVAHCKNYSLGTHNQEGMWAQEGWNERGPFKRLIQGEWGQCKVRESCWQKSRWIPGWSPMRRPVGYPCSRKQAAADWDRQAGEWDARNHAESLLSAQQPRQFWGCSCACFYQNLLKDKPNGEKTQNKERYINQILRFLPR